MSNLRRAAIGEQLAAGHVAAVVGGEKQRRGGDLARIVQLRELVAADVLVRRDYRQVPPKVDYSMTAFGERLSEALMPLCEWGTRNRRRVEARRSCIGGMGAAGLFEAGG